MWNKRTMIRTVFLSLAMFTMAGIVSDAQVRDRDNNPPGTNWENPPGPSGGPGTSPNR
jgi:hypothetical protein